MKEEQSPEEVYTIEELKGLASDLYQLRDDEHSLLAARDRINKENSNVVQEEPHPMNNNQFSDNNQSTVNKAKGK